MDIEGLHGLGTIISKDRARAIASDWHNGQWSPFYQFSSSGIYLPEKHKEYLTEVNEDIAQATREGKKQEVKALTALKKFFQYKAKEAGLQGLGEATPWWKLDESFVNSTKERKLFAASNGQRIYKNKDHTNAIATINKSDFIGTATGRRFKNTNNGSVIVELLTAGRDLAFFNLAEGEYVYVNSGDSLSAQQKDREARANAQALVKKDIDNLARTNHLMLVFEEANKLGVNISGKAADALKVANSIQQRQKDLQDFAAKQGWKIETTAPPATLAKNTAGVNGLGFIPLIVIGIVFLAGVLITAAAWAYFNSLRDKAVKDSRSIDELYNYLEGEVKAGRLTREKADSIYKAVQAYGDDAFNAGEKKQWWKSAGTIVTVGGGIAATAAFIKWGIPAIESKFKRKAA